MSWSASSCRYRQLTLYIAVLSCVSGSIDLHVAFSGLNSCAEGRSFSPPPGFQSGWGVLVKKGVADESKSGRDASASTMVEPGQLELIRTVPGQLSWGHTLERFTAGHGATRQAVRVGASKWPPGTDTEDGHCQAGPPRRQYMLSTPTRRREYYRTAAACCNNRDLGADHRMPERGRSALS